MTAGAIYGLVVVIVVLAGSIGVQAMRGKNVEYECQDCTARFSPSPRPFGPYASSPGKEAPHLPSVWHKDLGGAGSQVMQLAPACVLRASCIGADALSTGLGTSSSRIGRPPQPHGEESGQNGRRQGRKQHRRQVMGGQAQGVKGAQGAERKKEHESR